jgi:hypothetical protein
MKTFLSYKWIKAAAAAFFLHISAPLASAAGADTSGFKLQALYSGNAFFVNNEYFNDIVSGYTLPGYWHLAKLGLSNGEASLYAGIFAHRYFGLDTPESLQPVFTVELGSSSRFRAAAGSLQGQSSGMAHQLICNDRAAANPLQQGLLVSTVQRRLRAAMWLEWEDFLWHGQDKQEVFNLCGDMAATFNIHPNVSISLPLQFVVHHKGGQVNALPKKDMVMVVNNAAGAEAKLQKDSSGLTYIAAGYMFLGYADRASNSYGAYKNGQGQQIQLSAARHNFSASYSYWWAAHYISSIGAPIYGSQPYDRSSSLLLPLRSLSIVSAGYSGIVSQFVKLKLEQRFYYDHHAQLLDHSQWISLGFALGKNLKKIEQLSVFTK